MYELFDKEDLRNKIKSFSSQDYTVCSFQQTFRLSCDGCLCSITHYNLCISIEFLIKRTCK